MTSDDTEARACPCVHTTPCQANCTCVNPHMSHGCLRCCSYGSKAQQVAAAERIAGALDARPPADDIEAVARKLVLVAFSEEELSRPRASLTPGAGAMIDRVADALTATRAPLLAEIERLRVRRSGYRVALKVCRSFIAHQSSPLSARSAM